jgi:hypothetical protein
MADAAAEQSQEAHSGRCKELAGPHPALKAGTLYVYAKKRHHDDIGKTFFVCTGHRHVHVLPGQDGGDTLFPAHFATRDNRLAYAVSQEEPASPISPSYIYELNARTGDRLVNQASAWPDDNVQASVDVLKIVVAPNGSIAWLAHLRGQQHDYAVERIAAGGTRLTLALGPDIDPASLSASPHGTTVSWIQGGQPASAPLA